MLNIETHIKPKVNQTTNYKLHKKKKISLKLNQLKHPLILKDPLEEKRKCSNLTPNTHGNKISYSKKINKKNHFQSIKPISKSGKVFKNLLAIFFKTKILKRYYSTTNINKIHKMKEKIHKQKRKIS